VKEDKKIETKEIINFLNLNETKGYPKKQ